MELNKKLDNYSKYHDPGDYSIKKLKTVYSIGLDSNKNAIEMQMINPITKKCTIIPTKRRGIDTMELPYTYQRKSK